tara:strand:+ start:2069 stop:2998 length:930 start_codon:yes stop_codon:yes gene_type:complete
LEGKLKAIIGLMLALIVTTTGAQAASKSTGQSDYITDNDRIPVGGRDVQVSVEQSQIGTSFDTGRVASPPGGGLLDTLIIGAMDNKRELIAASLAERADGTVSPLRKILENVDVGALAVSHTNAAFAKLDWFELNQIIFTKDQDQDNPFTLFESNAAPQVGLVDYHYELSPDFSHIRIIAEVSLARQGEKKRTKKNPAYQIFFRQNLISIVQLHKRSYEHHENVASWSADDGKLAKQALTAAFVQIERLIPFALGLSQSDIASYSSKKREKAFGAGLYGPLIERGKNGAGDILIWNDGLTHIQTLPGDA